MLIAVVNESRARSMNEIHAVLEATGRTWPITFSNALRFRDLIACSAYIQYVMVR